MGRHRNLQMNQGKMQRIFDILDSFICQAALTLGIEHRFLSVPQQQDRRFVASPSVPDFQVDVGLHPLFARLDVHPAEYRR